MKYINYNWNVEQTRGLETLTGRKIVKADYKINKRLLALPDICNRREA